VVAVVGRTGVNRNRAHTVWKHGVWHGRCTRRTQLRCRTLCRVRNEEVTGRDVPRRCARWGASQARDALSEREASTLF